MTLKHASTEETTKMPRITYVSNQPEEYTKAIGDAATLQDLRVLLEGWKDLASDALAVVKAMNEDDFQAWRKGLKKERSGRFAGDRFSDRFGALLLPAVLLKVAMVAEQYGVPWGCAYIRLKETGQLEKALS